MKQLLFTSMNERRSRKACKIYLMSTCKFQETDSLIPCEGVFFTVQKLIQIALAVIGHHDKMIMLGYD